MPPVSPSCWSRGNVLRAEPLPGGHGAATAALLKRLVAERVVTVSGATWNEHAGSFAELERHSTCGAGDLLLARTPAGLVAVEQPPQTDERVRRHFPDAGAAQRFIADRLAAYERMWDGCGCRIDYYA
jgi:hypothetical protein